MTNEAPPTPELVIEPGRGAGSPRYWRDLWEYRGLFLFLAWRELLLRYKQTLLGVAWSVLRPLLTMAALTLVFGGLARLPSGGTPYPLLVLAGLLPWQLFASTLAEGSQSLVNNANMLRKVFFPRLIIPVSMLVVGLADLLISFLLFLALLAWYQVPLTPRVLALPLFLLLAVLAVLGPAVWLAALSVRYRDVRHVVPFLVQIGLYLSPVGFRSEAVPERWRLLVSLNPMAGAIDGFRWCLLGGASPLPREGILLSLAISLAVLAAGVAYFRSTERTFADVV